MKGTFAMAVAAATSLFATTLAAPVKGPSPIVVSPKKDAITIASHNTLNSTSMQKEMRPASAATPLQFSLTNNFDGDQMYAYITGKDVNSATVMLSTNGTWYYPDAAGSAEPVPVDSASTAIALKAFGSITEFSIPDYISSGRVYVSEGELTFNVVAAADGTSTLVEPAPTNPDDPSAGINWGFVELTNTADAGIYANISFVDFVGLVMAMKLTLGSGETQEVQGLQQTAVQDICDDLVTQAGQDQQPWDKLCQTADDGTALRILAPNLYLSEDPSAWSTYYDDYIEQVWSTYTDSDLNIDCQNDLGVVPCRASGDSLTCTSNSTSSATESFDKPVMGDILGCNSGPFENNPDTDSDLRKAIVPRLCAAFHRTTLLEDGGDTQPGPSPDTYYSNDPTVHYSRIVHSYETDGKGYTFAYDDVNPEGENAAGVVAGMDPIQLQITVGGLSS